MLPWRHSSDGSFNTVPRVYSSADGAKLALNNMHTLPRIAAQVVPGDPTYEGAVSTLAQSFRDGNVTLFTGAGISRPSGLPLSWTLVEGLVDAICDALDITGLGTTNDRDGIRQVIKGYPLERLLDALVDLHGEQALEYISVLQHGTENYNHRSIAKLAKQGLADSIVTLNFDVLFEQALRSRGVSFAWHLPLAVTDRRIPDKPAQVTITKPHGTLPFPGFPYAPHYLAATLRYAGDRPQRENAQALASIAKDKPVLLVAGYSNDDWDVSPLLTVAPWSHVYWCEYVPPTQLGTFPMDKPCQRILSWLSGRDERKTVLLFGDVRTLLDSVLRVLGLALDHGDERDPSGLWREQPQREPDGSTFVRNPAPTVLAAVQLLDGTENELFRRLLPKIGALPPFAQDGQLRDRWEKAMAWYYHAHRRDIRKAIAIRRRLLKEAPPIPPERQLEHLADLRSTYYEYISAAKRPLLNPRWPFDLRKAFSLRRLLWARAEEVKNGERNHPWIVREAERHVAFADYYLVDLLHNWGYYLLPFNNWLVRRLTRKVFRRIAQRYRHTANRHPVLDWEYHYVRSVEAALIGDEDIELAAVQWKLSQIADMFRRTGQQGHFAYVSAVLAVIRAKKAQVDFSKVVKSFFDERSGSTPAGKLRMRLFQRYFWPETVAGFRALRDLFKYSTLQRP